MSDLGQTEYVRAFGEKFEEKLHRKVDYRVFEIEIEGIKETHRRDVEALKEDFIDLRNSYRKLVSVAVGEAIGLLVAIVLIAVQLALAFGAGQGTGS